MIAQISDSGVDYGRFVRDVCSSSSGCARQTPALAELPPTSTLAVACRLRTSPKCHGIVEPAASFGNSRFTRGRVMRPRFIHGQTQSTEAHSGRSGRATRERICARRKRKQHGSHQNDDENEGSGEGWLIFAGIALLIAGVMRIFDAIWAFRYHGALPSNLEDATLGHSLKTYGWVYLIVGIVVILAGIGVMVRSQFARWIGIIAAAILGISAIWWMPYLPHLVPYLYWDLLLCHLRSGSARR